MRARPAVTACGSCISRRDARRSGCGPPASASPGGNADANPATHRARSRTHENTPPIGANAPYGSNGTSSQPAGPRRYPRARLAAGNSDASNPVLVIPSGASSRVRVNSSYGTPAACATTRPRIA